ncbi:hypothetical protein U0070_004714 [Myodes glareolus]|uniref:Uncharacterized protein n=1 Tax=Myodes glareolus TaxID=447135 RepID=A0AAW0I9V0_MYOGA
MKKVCIFIESPQAGEELVLGYTSSQADALKDLEPLQRLVARGRAFASGSRALRLRSTERPHDAAGRARRRRSWLGRDFLPPGRDN